MGPFSANLAQLVPDRNNSYHNEYERYEDTSSCYYASEVSRLASFNKSWFCDNPNYALWFNPSIWAKNGFFCKISNNILQCFSCEKTVDYLAQSSDPSSPSSHFEYCRLVHGTETRNKPISEWKPKGCTPLDKIDGYVATPNLDCVKHDCEYSEHHRIASFHSSPAQFYRFACGLAEMGFYYLKDANKAKCFSCGNLISEKQLSDSDNPRNQNWHDKHCAMIEGKEAKNIPLQDRKKANDMDPMQSVNPFFQPSLSPKTTSGLERYQSIKTN